MSLSRITLRLARNPGTAFADGDDHRGYTLTAPLTAEGYLDVDGFHAVRDLCHVHRFAAGEDPVEGRLVRRGRGWFIDYDDDRDGDDEPLYRLGEHRFAVGDYVTVTHHDDGALTYKVTEVRHVT